MKHQAQDKDPRYAVVHECTLESIVLMDPATRKTEKVTIGDFSKEWVVVMDAAEVQDRGAIVNWADMGGMKTGDHIDQRAKAHVLSALDRVAEQLSNQKRADLQVLTKPKLAVFAASDIDEGGLALCPMTHKSTVHDSSTTTKVPAAGVRVSCNLPENKTFFLQPHFVAPRADKPEVGFVEPFWAVRRVGKDSGEEHKVNCYIEYVAVTFAGVVNHNAWLERFASKWSVEVPILVNKRKITKGEELVWEDSAMASKKRKEALVFMKPAKGKAKTAAKE